MLEDNFTIHPFSDRMGYQLNGADLSREQNTELVSSGVSFGTIQLLPNGQLIVLMADHQTTGGYPRIAQVASVDLPRLAQYGPGDVLWFDMISIEAAQQLLLARVRELRALQPVD
jgi:antagonist of KipI